MTHEGQWESWIAFPWIDSPLSQLVRHPGPSYPQTLWMCCQALIDTIIYPVRPNKKKAPLQTESF